MRSSSADSPKREKKTGWPCSSNVQSAWMIFPLGAVNARAPASCELAARHWRDLSTRQAPWRLTRGRVAGAGEKPVLYERGGDRAVGLLGANERGTATPGPAGLVDEPCRCYARTHLWFQHNQWRMSGLSRSTR